MLSSQAAQGHTLREPEGLSTSVPPRGSFPGSIEQTRERGKPWLDCGSASRESADPTSRILSNLATHHNHSTCFITGGWAKENPVLVQRVWKEGREIGNHTMHHQDLTTLSERSIRSIGRRMRPRKRLMTLVVARAVSLFSSYGSSAHGGRRPALPSVRCPMQERFVTILSDQR